MPLLSRPAPLPPIHFLSFYYLSLIYPYSLQLFSRRHCFIPIYILSPVILRFLYFYYLPPTSLFIQKFFVFFFNLLFISFGRYCGTTSCRRAALIICESGKRPAPRVFLAECASPSRSLALPMERKSSIELVRPGGCRIWVWRSEVLRVLSRNDDDL